MILRELCGLIMKPLNIYIPFDSGILLLGVCPKENNEGAEEDSSIRIFIANFVVQKIRNNLNVLRKGHIISIQENNRLPSEKDRWTNLFNDMESCSHILLNEIYRLEHSIHSVIQSL